MIAWQLKCSGQRPSCKRCTMKKIDCRYPIPESRRRKGQTEQNIASRQAASAARSRKVNDKIPRELQGVFSVTLPDVVSSGPPPAVEQLHCPNPTGRSSGTDEPQLDSGCLFDIDGPEFDLSSPADWPHDSSIDGRSHSFTKRADSSILPSQLTLSQAAQVSAGIAQCPTSCLPSAPTST